MIRQTWLQMGMPITVCIADEDTGDDAILAVRELLERVNQRFSTYLETSEVSRFNRGELSWSELSPEMLDILKLCEQTRVETEGYFDIASGGQIDPSGLVKGWAIQKASDLLSELEYGNHVVDAGGDVQAVGLNGEGQPWSVGIRNPFKRDEVVKVLAISGGGVATSGTAIRGEHIYDPFCSGPVSTDVVSLTVVGPSIYEADRFATAAFAMGDDGLDFIAEWPELEGYAISSDGMARFTRGFSSYVR